MPALPYPDHPLSDGRVRLRAWTCDDVGAITAACQDAQIQRFIAGLPVPYATSDARSYLEGAERERRAGAAITMAVVDTEDRVLGAVTADRCASQRSASVTFWLAVEARGHGHASAGLRLFCSYLFNELVCERISLSTDPENLDAQRVAASCGFRQEGYLAQARHHGEAARRDAILWGLLKHAAPRQRREIVWLNGTFGAGKSATATELLARRANLIVFDPEYVGFLLAESVPVPSGDFQDLPEWRELTVASLVSLARHQAGPLLVPMTLLRHDYRLEIFAGLRAHGIGVIHALIDAPDGILSARIAGDQGQPDEAVAFRHAKLGAYSQAREALRLSADRVIDTATLNVTQVADRVEPLLRRS